MPFQPMPVDVAAAIPGPGQEAIRRALRGPPGRVALRLPVPPAAGARRAAFALLAEAAAPRGGSVLATGEDWVLTDAFAEDAERAAAGLGRLLGAPPERLRLPDDAAPLLALRGAVPVHPCGLVLPPAGGIEAAADAVPLAGVVRREGVLHIAPGAPRRLALLGLRLGRSALVPHLGEAAADPDLVRHALDRLRGALFARLAEPGPREALLGAAPPVPLLIDLPLAHLPQPPTEAGEREGEAAEVSAPPALFAALSAAESVVEGLAARRDALRRAGWGIAVRGLDAARLALLAPEALPADLLLLGWSEALAGRASAAALRRADPGRLVLAGCDGPAALEWGLGLGIARYAGPWIDGLMAATRMGRCDHAPGCSRAHCAARGAAADPAGRGGCAALPLLGALLPP